MFFLSIHEQIHRSNTYRKSPHIDLMVLLNRTFQSHNIYLTLANAAHANPIRTLTSILSIQRRNVDMLAFCDKCFTLRQN